MAAPDWLHEMIDRAHELIGPDQGVVCVVVSRAVRDAIDGLDDEQRLAVSAGMEHWLKSYLMIPR